MKLPTLSLTTKKIIAYAAICALIFIAGTLIPSRNHFVPQTPSIDGEIAMWKDSIDKAQKIQATLIVQLKKSEASADVLRKTLRHQKMEYTTELARIRTLPPDSLYDLFAEKTGGIDTTAEKAYRIPTENIMQADIIFAQRDYLLQDTTTQGEIMSALGTQVNLLHAVITASDKEKAAIIEQRDLYKTDAQVQADNAKQQAKLTQKEHRRADWTRIGWVASEIATIVFFIAL